MSVVIEGVILANEVTAIPRSDLIAEIVEEVRPEAERVRRLLALGCDVCEAAASTIVVMDDLDRTVRIVCDEHRPGWTW